jgi:hypothetical protein
VEGRILIMNILPNIWVFGLEPLDNRYTAQWHTNIPQELANKASNQANICSINGVQTSSNTTSGAFLNFSDTNRWKSTQLVEFLNKMDAGLTTPNDVFLFTDAWNPVILQIKYINDLLGYNWKIHGLWHSGAYDPTDILGYKMAKPWPWEFERSVFHACDTNWYATDFHRQMFLRNLGIAQEFHHKSQLSGQPHGSIVEHMKKAAANTASKQGVVWPHRYNDDKQPQIAEDLSAAMQLPWCITQKLDLNKHDYYQQLANSQVIFSCSLHENLGISIMEAVLADVIPVLPNRCSYSEMYADDFLYPSEWTANYENFQEHKQKLVDFIQYRLDHPKKFNRQLAKQKKVLLQRYLSADVMFDSIVQDIANSTQTI